jgi:WD40 repeat protein
MIFFTPLELDSLEHSSSVFSLCKDNGGKKFFSGSYGEIKIWSAEDFNLINTLYGHQDYITHMEIIRKQIDPFIKNVYKDYLCSCSYDNTIKIWDIELLNCVCTLSGHTDHITYFLQNEPGLMISCSFDKSIKFWNIEEEKCYLSLMMLMMVLFILWL